MVTKKASDVGKFKTPSLRNLVYTAPYMHDGRFATLEEVINFYSDSVKANSTNIDNLMFDRGSHIANLSDQEKDDLVAFLRAITDSSFVNNPLNIIFFDFIYKIDIITCSSFSYKTSCLLYHAFLYQRTW